MDMELIQPAQQPGQSFRMLIYLATHMEQREGWLHEPESQSTKSAGWEAALVQTY